jgi:hypothetical protein
MGDDYQLRVLTRCRVGHLFLRPGAVLLVPGDRLRAAAFLCRNGTARPADERTRLDVDLFIELQSAFAAQVPR